MNAPTPAERTALLKALRTDGPSQVRRLSHGRYAVPSASAPSLVYVVTGTAYDGSDHRCTCPAGSFGKPCSHKASVRLRRVRETALSQARRLYGQVPA